MEEYLELVTMVMGFSIHLEDVDEVIDNVWSYKSELFDANDDVRHYDVIKRNKGISVTYTDSENKIRIENLITVKH